MREVIAYLGLGANLGTDPDTREVNLRTALQRLGQTPGITVLAVSSLRQWPFVGEGPPQAPYLNGAAKIATVLPAAALLAVCKALERAAGRAVPAPHHQPRPLDLDLLLYGDEPIDTADLAVPHPRAHAREFVRVPLAELGVDPARLTPPARPRLLTAAAPFAALCSQWQQGGCDVGLVPTMGALHRGHQSLIAAAAAACDRVAVTIFVNPLQFGPKEDFAAYPRPLAQDLELCAAAGADAVFAPTPEQMYGDGFCSRIAVGTAAEGMEGAVRPGHFSGVATAVARLLSLSRPQRAYFGEKDAQQLAVIRQLVSDLGLPTEVVPCAIVREADGLAMSSRNVYLGAADRRASAVLFAALSAAAAAFAAGERDRDRLLAVARQVLAAEPRAALEYLELRADGDLRPLPAGPVAAGRMLVAARFVDGPRPVRLLDNLRLGAP